MPKNIFHSKLMSASKKGILSLSVRGDVSHSKYPDKPDYVKIELNGEEFYFSPDNDACLEAFRGQAGKTITIQLEGGGKGLEHTSKITRVGSPGSQTPQPQRNQRPATPEPEADPQDDGRDPEPPPETASSKPPATRQATKPADVSADALTRCKVFLNGNQTLIRLALKKVGDEINHIEAAWQETGEAFVPLTRDQKIALIGIIMPSMCFGASNAGVSGAMLPPSVEKGGAK